MLPGDTVATQSEPAHIMGQPSETAPPRVRSGVTEVHPLEHGVGNTQNNPSSGRGKTSPGHSGRTTEVGARCFPPTKRVGGDPGRLSVPALLCVEKWAVARGDPGRLCTRGGEGGVEGGARVTYSWVVGPRSGRRARQLGWRGRGGGARVLIGARTERQAV